MSLNEKNQIHTLPNKVKLTANVFFSGIGAQERGFENSGLFDIDVLTTSDIDKEAVVSYAAVHCGLTPQMIEEYENYPSREEMAEYLTKINLGYKPEKDKKEDWYKVARRKKKDIEKYWLACKLSNNKGDISKIEDVPYADLWTISFPCFTGDTLVLTADKGYVSIKDTKEGDLVLSHDNQYRLVTKSLCTGIKPIWVINAMMNDEIRCTENHKFYVRTRHRVNTRKKGKPINYRWFDKPAWKECKRLTNDDYLGYAINQNSIIPTWVDSDRNRTKIASLMNNESFWWIIGRYIADGFKQTSKTGSKIVLCCGKSKVKDGLIEKHLNNCGLNFCTDDQRTCLKYHICSNGLYEFIKQFGDRAIGKCVPSFVIDMPLNLCKAFLDGYWSGDGCFTNGQYKATSISRELIYGIGQLIAKVYRRPFSIYKTKRKPTTIIEGRTVNQHDTYSIAFKTTADIQDKAFYEDGYIWFPIKSVQFTDECEPVYDITVEDAHSFTANGAIVHNCTDISVAGKMKGLNPDSSTRSSLLWENIRLLKNAVDGNKSPKYIMFENVKNLVGKKFIDDFNSLIEVLEELGYNTYWKVINGKECGIPQNRERVFAFAIRKDIDTGKMDFPMPFDNGIRLKDVLEDNVDEKYYISSDALKRFITTSNSLSALMYDACQAKREGKSREYNDFCPTITSRDYKDPRLINEDVRVGIDKSVNDTKIIDRANCITAREDRGISNRKAEGTAVLEQMPVNAYSDGTCRTLKAQYANTSAVNLVRTGTFGATGVLEPNNINMLGLLDIKGNEQVRRVYDEEGVSPTLNTMQGGNRQPKILQRPRGNNKGGEHEDCTTISSHAWEQNNVLMEWFLEHARIRKLTPKECWRLMGFNDVDIDNAIAVGVFDSQLYKQAGNSIITNCVELLAEHLYKAQYDGDYICFDENFIKPQAE